MPSLCRVTGGFLYFGGGVPIRYVSHQECNLYKNAIVLYQDRRASTPLTACLSQNGGHHLVWPQRRVPPSKVLEHLLEEAGWRLVLPPAHERLTNNATKPGALHAHLDILLTLADLVRSARPNASRFPITLTAPRLSSATTAQRTSEIDKTARTHRPKTSLA